MRIHVNLKKQIRLFAEETFLCVIVESDVIGPAIANDIKLKNGLHNGYFYPYKTVIINHTRLDKPHPDISFRYTINYLDRKVRHCYLKLFSNEMFIGMNIFQKLLIKQFSVRIFFAFLNIN